MILLQNDSWSFLIEKKVLHIKLRKYNKTFLNTPLQEFLIKTSFQPSLPNYFLFYQTKLQQKLKNDKINRENNFFQVQLWKKNIFLTLKIQKCSKNFLTFTAKSIFKIFQGLSKNWNYRFGFEIALMDRLLSILIHTKLISSTFVGEKWIKVSGIFRDCVWLMVIRLRYQVCNWYGLGEFL